MGFFQLLCTNKVSDYGMQYNSVRDNLGLSLLSENFELTKQNNSYEIWENENCKTGCHFKKKIMYPNGLPTTETDEYTGTKFYKTIDGTFKENLFITYHYKKKKDESRWEYTLFDQPSVNEGFLGKKITKRAAKAILKKWNITH